MPIGKKFFFLCKETQVIASMQHFFFRSKYVAAVNNCLHLVINFAVFQV